MRVIPLSISNLNQIRQIMHALGVDPEGIRIMANKSIHRVFKVEGIDSYIANILKQELLSLGADSALPKDALLRRRKIDILIFGTLSQLNKLIGKIKKQPFNLLKDLASILEERLKDKVSFVARGKRLNLSKPVVCGIVNVTFDSFSGDGLMKKTKGDLSKLKEEALRITERMVKEGAKIIDFGAESSRPFSRPIPEDEELKRLIPILKVVRRKFKDIFISVDTYKYRVAKEAIEEGADIINDITALRKNPRIAYLLKKYKVGCILMHMKGTPSTMQINPSYRDVVREIASFLERRVNFCLEQGVEKNQIMIDPGIGFGKRVRDNLEIINRLQEFKFLGLPIFLGVSRKSFIGKVLNVDVGERLIGTIATIVIAILKGANVLRVHDVKQVYEAIKMSNRILCS